jgi:hypothetical protein
MTTMNFQLNGEIEKKITLTKGQNNQNNKDQIKKIICHKFGLKDETENK